MQLFGSYTSPFVRHCRIAIRQQDLPVTFIATTLEQAQLDSPTMKLPYFKDDQTLLTDSSVILRYLRQQSSLPFCAEIQDHECFALASTLLDAGISAVMLARADGLTAANSAFAAKQQARVTQSLAYLDQLIDPRTWSFQNDGHIRLACALDWGLFRQSFSLEAYPQLHAVLGQANEQKHFVATAPHE
ncbi:glutathione S-transferase family protein [Motilimonas pumila]|nr:glutathione S-transferase [Motilimonas pumila]